MEGTKAEEGGCWDQYGTIPVIAMRDVPRGDQDTGRGKLRKLQKSIDSGGGNGGRNIKLAGIFTYFNLFNLGPLAINVMKVSFKMVRAH